ncbi:hypothetical protein LIQ24_14165 [Blautia faecis]|jgi:hypothetical protein|uniref:hypothetical protein n=1 Tax=Lachnospiraceae TaxID=186803 RepID=UPI000E483284|nr:MULTISPECIES: hypothetical protein [Lachnospiraceae]MCB5482978.1 hypothetical protein [Blautia faecis]RHS58352.1 hypothetical protein DW958_20660 [Ruminococcus sp. AM46-18]RHU48120.1 hypothetical protein DXD11_13770 [Coprococcus sp. TF11-13]
MAALGGSRHALINLSTQIDIPPIIKKSLSPATGYFGHKDERKKEVLDAYHSAVEKAAPEKPKEAEPKKGKRAAKKKHSEIDL